MSGLNTSGKSNIVGLVEHKGNQTFTKRIEVTLRSTKQRVYN